ncbi:hypothetical protein Q9L58_002410 [Maublancomyces gigas]|uniref:Small EDRK-rich factor-like N-terminal domain-containing protein n=1 Tax=Discina gigas TaxID=1032678 RepID=A0ABR3GRE3_9PEZI
MTRGNQRERDRAKAQKTAVQQKSKNGKSGTAMQRDKENVAEIMRQKQVEAEEKRKADAAKADSGSSSSDPPKKK